MKNIHQEFETGLELLVKTIILKEINHNVFECNKIYSSLYQSIRLRLGGLNALRQPNYDSMFIMSQWSYSCYLLSIAMNWRCIYKIWSDLTEWIVKSIKRFEGDIEFEIFLFYGRQLIVRRDLVCIKFYASRPNQNAMKIKQTCDEDVKLSCVWPPNAFIW